MERIEVRQFEALKDMLNPNVYLSHTDIFTLISIPDWNWSFLWRITNNDEEVKLIFISALISHASHYFDNESAEKFAEEVYQYLLGKGIK